MRERLDQTRGGRGQARVELTPREEDVGAGVPPESTQTPSSSTQIPEATTVLMDAEDAAQGEGEPQNGLQDDVSPTTMVRAEAPAGVSPPRDGMATRSALKRVQDYAETHGLGKDLTLTLSRYPDGITVERLAAVEETLRRRGASEAAKVKA